MSFYERFKVEKDKLQKEILEKEEEDKLYMEWLTDYDRWHKLFGNEETNNVLRMVTNLIMKRTVAPLYCVRFELDPVFACSASKGLSHEVVKKHFVRWLKWYFVSGLGWEYAPKITIEGSELFEDEHVCAYLFKEEDK